MKGHTRVPATNIIHLKTHSKLSMKMKKTTVICLLALLCSANLAQSIVNTTRNVIQTTTTAENMVKNFQETVKIYEQGKKYYDGAPV